MLIQRAFGQRIQALRKEKGLSQEKFALTIEMDRTYYASVEAGRRNISLVNIKKLQMVLVFRYLNCFLICRRDKTWHLIQTSFFSKSQGM